MDAVKLVRVGKEFKGIWVLEDVSISLPSGGIYGIVGRNGTGKTVFLKLIAGLIKPTAGEVWVDEKKLTKETPIPDSIGVVIEVPGFLPNLSGYKNLKYLASMKNQIGDSEIKKAMERLGLDPKEHKRVGSYSLGMRQKLGIAQAIMENPELLLLDEPMNGLDEASVAKVKNILLDYKKTGKTVILASHHKDDINELCDKVYEMNEGRVIPK